MYRLVVWMMALALVFNGAAAYALDDLSGIAVVAAFDHHAEAADVECHAGKVAVVAADACQSQHAAHDHLKCCPICNVVSMLPALVAVAVPFSYAPVSFRTAEVGLVGHLVALDPDIPKTVV